MRFVLIIAAFLCAAELCAYASIQQDVIERDTIGSGGGGGGGDLSSSDIDTFAELDAIVADEGLLNLNDSQTLLNKVIDGNSNTVKLLRHATDCTSYTGAVDGQYCWEQDDDLLYVCETADVCDTAGEWDAVASTGNFLPFSGGTLSGDLLIGDSAAIRCVSDNGCDLGSAAARFGPFYATSILFANSDQGIVQRDAADSTYISLIWLDNQDVINIGNGIEAGISLASPIPDSQVSHEPLGNIESTDVRDAIYELDTEKPDRSKIKTLFVFRPTMNEPPASNFTTIDTRNSHPVLDFDGSTNESAVFTFVMPQAYSGGGVTVYIHYAMTSATSGDIDWDVAFERVGDQQQDIDSDSFATAQSVDNTVVPGTSGNVDVVSVSFTNGAQMDSCAAGEVCRIKITRDAASDTDNTDAELVAAELRES